MNRAVRRWQADSRVEDAFNDSDGYWVYLKPGFRAEPELHMIHEDTVRATDACLRGVEPCTCNACTEAKETAT